jgi:hypothetical protein
MNGDSARTLDLLADKPLRCATTGLVALVVIRQQFRDIGLSPDLRHLELLSQRLLRDLVGSPA